MNDGTLQRVVDTRIDGLVISTAPTGTSPPLSAFARITMSGSISVVVGSEKLARAIHSRLDFVGNEQRSVLAAKFLCIPKIVGLRETNSRFALNRLNEERSESPRFQQISKSLQVAKRDSVRTLQHRSKSIAPELVTHERQRTAGESMKCAVGVDQVCASRKRPRKLDRGFHAFASRTGKESLPDHSAGDLQSRSASVPAECGTWL